MRLILERADDGATVTPTEIAQALAVSTASVTGMLDRLAAGGLIGFVANPADRRSKFVVPSTAARTRTRSTPSRRGSASSPWTCPPGRSINWPSSSIASARSSTPSAAETDQTGVGSMASGSGSATTVSPFGELASCMSSSTQRRFTCGERLP